MAEKKQDRHHNILLVDDHEITSSALSILLDTTPFDLLGWVRTAEETLHVVQSEAIDIVVLDLGLPGDGGLSILAQLVAAHDITVVVLSGSTSSADFAAAKELGARCLINKADPTAAILEALERAVAGEFWCSPTVERALRHEADYPALTPRQRAILHFVAKGESNKEIGYRLAIAPPTVSFHLREIREKLGAKTNKQIVSAARQIGMI